MNLPREKKSKKFGRNSRIREKVNRHIYWTIYDEKQEIKCKEGQEMKFIKPEEFGGKKFLPGQEKLLKLAIKRAQELSGSIMIHAVIFDVGGVLHTSIGELVKKDICKTLGDRKSV